MEEILSQLVCKIFKIRPQEVHDGLSSEQIENWDSMNYLILITEVETRFNIQFTTEEVITVQNLGELKNLIKHYIKNR